MLCVVLVCMYMRDEFVYVDVDVYAYVYVNVDGDMYVCCHPIYSRHQSPPVGICERTSWDWLVAQKRREVDTAARSWVFIFYFGYDG